MRVLIIIVGITLIFIISCTVRKVEVETQAMYPELHEGDIVKIYKTENYNRFDLVYFSVELNKPVPQNNKIIFRIAGLPGDTIEIIESISYINGKLLEDTNNLLFWYKTQFDKNKLVGIVDFFDDNRFLTTPLCLTELEKIQNGKAISKAFRKKDSTDFLSFELYGFSEYVKWNVDFMGPIYIPKKGDTIKITMENLALFKDIIVQNSDKSINIQSLKFPYYLIIKHDYFFLLGDGRSISLDSRYWGLLPKFKIIGKAILWKRNVSEFTSIYNCKTTK